MSTDSSTDSTNPPSVTLSSNFVFSAANLNPTPTQKLQPQVGSPQTPVATPVTQAPLGVLSNFTGQYEGNGLNLIFRPNSAAPTTTTFPNPIPPPAAPAPPNENVLEINMTAETLTFSNPLGAVPNRGLEKQNDITLNGVPYVQAINDVTNLATGKGDGTATGIHFEPGLWMAVPATKTTPVLAASLVRMASIPHGTTINAQGLAPTGASPGPPKFLKIDITPFIVQQPTQLIRFNSQTAANTATPRLPQDLSKFIAAGTITQAILDNPSLVLSNANAGKTIIQTTVFSVSTLPANPELGGGTDNIAFLLGDTTGNTGNANAARMDATFWVSTVQHTLNIPVFTLGQAPLKIAAPTTGLGPGPHPTPVFLVQPPHAITVPRTITVTSTQIQYSQIVFLNFAGLTWPHVSVATLVPSALQTVPASAWN